MMTEPTTSQSAMQTQTQTQTQAQMQTQPLAQRAPNTDGIWYASYAPGVPREIDTSQYASVVAFFDECTTRFRERVAYVSVGESLTYGELARKATASPSCCRTRFSTPSRCSAC